MPAARRRRRNPSSAPHQKASATKVAFCSASEATNGRAAKISDKKVSSMTCSAVAHPRAKANTDSLRSANRQNVPPSRASSSAATRSRAAQARIRAARRAWPDPVAPLSTADAPSSIARRHQRAQPELAQAPPRQVAKRGPAPPARGGLGDPERQQPVELTQLVSIIHEVDEE